MNEAYIRLVAQDMPDWQCRSHFFGVAAHLMRQILVDHARRHQSAKRGGDAPVLPLEEAFSFAASKSREIIYATHTRPSVFLFGTRKGDRYAIKAACASREAPATLPQGRTVLRRAPLSSEMDVLAVRLRA